MNIVEKLTERWRDINYPFLVHSSSELRFGEIAEQKTTEAIATARASGHPLQLKTKQVE